MRAAAPQGIEIAPASDFGGFKWHIPSPASIFPKIWQFPKFPVHAPSCLVRHNFLDSHRPEVIGRAHETPHTGGQNDPGDFSNNIVSGHENEGQRLKTYRLYDRRSSSNCPCRRYYSTVQPLYESCGLKRGRAARH